jgi:hypothetical protein
MENLKQMESLDEYNLFTEGGDDYIEPHVVYIPSSNLVKYKRIRKVTVGDIVYFNGTKIKTIEPHLYNVNLGYPLGVIAIPPGMLPDGKARYCSIYSNTINRWGLSDVNTSLQDYEWFPVFNEYYPDGIGLSNAYLPSDYYNGIRSDDDPKAYFYQTESLPHGEFGPCVSPSPYLGNDYTLNPKYITENFSNPFRDLDGLSNTRTLISLGLHYQAAHLANDISNGRIKSDIAYLNNAGLINYNSDLLNVETYLPSIGELGFIVARFKRIKQSMEIIFKELTELTDNWNWGINRNIFMFDLFNEDFNGINVYSSTEKYVSNCFIIRIPRPDKYQGFEATYKDKSVNYNNDYVLPFAILE